LTTARRGNKVVLLHGDTRIREGDRIVALADPVCVPKLRDVFEPVKHAPSLRERAGGGTERAQKAD
jgi:Trk K+ transport system NAD-binding subunit